MKGGQTYIYVMSREDGCHKIGVSGAPESRARDMRRATSQMVEIRHLWRRDRSDAFKIELAAHNSLDRFKVGGEWFAVSALQAHEAVVKAIENRDDYLEFCTRNALYKRFGPRGTPRFGKVTR